MNKNFNKLLSDAINAQNAEKIECLYCKKFKDFVDTDDLEIWIEDAELIIKNYSGSSIQPIVINYCPMCGEEL